MPIIIIEKPLNSKNKNKNKNKSTSPALPVAAAAAAAAAPLPLPHPVPVLDADEKLASTHIQVCAFFSSSSASSPPKQRWVGAGTLFTTNKNVVWLSNNTESKQNQIGFSIDFPFISFHAISKDVSLFPKPCIYCALDVPVSDSASDSDSDSDLEDDAVSNRKDEEVTCVFLVPAKASDLDTIYKAMCAGQRANPPPPQQL